MRPDGAAAGFDFVACCTSTTLMLKTLKSGTAPSRQAGESTTG